MIRIRRAFVGLAAGGMLLASGAGAGERALTPAQDAHEWVIYTKGQDLQLRAADDKLRLAERQSDQIVALEQARVDLYRQQLTLNLWIGIVVALVIGFAVLLSLVQAIIDAVKGNASESQISFDKDGLKISSSVMALFVLLAAIFFFHVYISDVYTIHEAGSAAVPKPSGPPSASPPTPSAEAAAAP